MSDEIWRFEVQRNPEGARYIWSVDIYRGEFHFREVEHNSRELAVRIASDIIQEQESDLLEDRKHPSSDQFRGLILGLAVGDAVGAPVEKASLGKTRRYIRKHVMPSDYEGVERSTFEKLPFGHYTDDTQMARELMLSIVDSGGTFDPANYAARIARLFKEDTIVGSGGTTRRAVDRLLEGVPWDEAGEGSSAGNGSAMRVAPIGMLENTSQVLEAATNQSLITHTHTTSVAASVFVAYMVHQALYYPHERTPLRMLAEAEAVLYLMLKGDEGVRPMYAATCELREHVEAGKGRREVLKNLLTFQDKTSWEGISPYALTSSLWAAYSFVTCPDNFGKLLETALWPAGDVDTIAAMAGAMWGARNGAEGLPDAVVSKLNDGGRWEAGNLRNLADQMYYYVPFRDPPPISQKFGPGYFNPSDTVRLQIRDEE